jgi:hypothetical protein
MAANLYTQTVPVPIWNWDVVAFYGTDKAQLQRTLQPLGIACDCPSAIGHTWVVEDTPVVLWVKDIADTPTLAHEAMHAVFGMLAARGLKHSAESEEAYTYTVSHILESLRKGKWKKVPNDRKE